MAARIFDGDSWLLLSPVAAVAQSRDRATASKAIVVAGRVSRAAINRGNRDKSADSAAINRRSLSRNEKAAMRLRALAHALRPMLGSWQGASTLTDARAHQRVARVPLCSQQSISGVSNGENRTARMTRRRERIDSRKRLGNDDNG
jgi:hypothetical protein